MKFHYGESNQCPEIFYIFWDMGKPGNNWTKKICKKNQKLKNQSTGEGGSEPHRAAFKIFRPLIWEEKNKFESL